MNRSAKVRAITLCLGIAAHCVLPATAQSPASRIPDVNWPKWSPGQTSWISEGLQQPDPGGIFHGLAVSADGLKLLHVTSRFPRRGATGESNLPDAEVAWTSPGTGGGFGVIEDAECVVLQSGVIHAYFTARVAVTDVNGATAYWLRLFHLSKPWCLPWEAPDAVSEVLVATTDSRESVIELAVSIGDGDSVTCWYEQEEKDYVLAGAWAPTKTVTKLWRHVLGSSPAPDAAGIEHNPSAAAPALAAHRGRVVRYVKPYGVAGEDRIYFHDGSSATLVRAHIEALGVGPCALYVASDSTPRITWQENTAGVRVIRHVSGTSGAVGEVWGPGVDGAVFPDANNVLHRFWLGPEASHEMLHSIYSGGVWTAPAISESPCLGMNSLGLDSPSRWHIVDGGPVGSGTLTWSWEDNLGMQDAPTMIPTAPQTWTNVSNGNVLHILPLFATVGLCPMPEMTLYYNSLDHNEGVCGQGWRHTYSISISECADGLLLTLPEGQRVVCEYNSTAGGWIPREEYGLSLRITDLGGSGGVRWRIEGITGVFWDLNSLGKPIAKSDRDGNTIQLTYSSDSKRNLIQISTDCKSVALTYDDCDRIHEITDPGGSRYELIYDDSLDALAEVRFKDAAGEILRVWSYGYFNFSGPTLPIPDGVALPVGSSEFPAVRGLLAQIKTPVQNAEASSSVRNFLFAYDHDGEFIARNTLYYDPEVTYSGLPSRKLIRFQYSDAPILIGGTVTFETLVIDREANEFQYFVDYIRNLAVLIVDPVNGSDNPTLRVFDARRNVTLASDPAGRTTIYTYVTPADGLASWAMDLVKTIQLPGDTSLTTIEYHPAWNLPSRITPVTGVSGAVDFTYDSEGHLVDLQFPLDPGPYIWTYDERGRVLRATDPGGSFTEFTYGECCEGPETEVHSGVVLDLTTPGGGTPGMPSTTTYSYNAMGLTVSEICPPEDEFQVVFNALQQPVQEVSPHILGPAVIQNAFDKNGNLVSRIDANSNETQFSRDDRGRVTQIRNPEGDICTFEWSPNSNLSRVVTYNGQELRSTWDALGRRLTRSEQVDEVSGLFLEWTGSYDGSNNLLAETIGGTGGNPPSRTTQYNWSARNLLEVLVLPGADTEIRFNYGARRELKSEETWWKAPSETSFEFLRGTGFTWDAQLRVLKRVEMDQPLSPSGTPTGRETSYGYTPAGMVSTITSPSGCVTELEYDLANRLSRSVDPTGVAATLQYDHHSRLKQVFAKVPGHGVQSPFTLAWDHFGNLEEVHDNISPLALASMSYDKGGRLTQTSGVLGLLQEREYTALDELKSVTVRRATGQYLRSEANYDDESNIISIVAPPGSAGGGPLWQYEYNIGNQVIGRSTPLGHSQSIECDAQGRVTHVIDESDNEASYTYDLRGRLTLTTWTRPGGSIWETIERTYDGADNLLSIESTMSGVRVEFQYRPDAPTVDNHTLELREVTWKLDGAIWKQLKYDYDADGNRTTTQILDAAGLITHTQTFAYDAADRLKSIANDGVEVAQLEYEDGLLVKTTFPQTGNRIIRFYGRNAHLSAIAHLNAQGSALALIEYAEDGRQRLTEAFYAHLDLKSQYGYSDNSWLVSEQHVAPAGGPTWTNQEVAVPGGNASSPASSQVVVPNPGLCNSALARTHSFDLRGNRVQSTGPGYLQVCQYDSDDRLISEQRNGVPTTYSWDERGCLLAKTENGITTTFENDYLGRVVTTTSPSIQTHDVFSPTGQRLAHIDLTGTFLDEWYLSDGTETLADYSRSGTSEDFDGLYASVGNDEKLARLNANGQTSYFFQDRLGSVHQFSNASGQVTRTSLFDAWGTPISIGIAQPPIGLISRWGFAGRETVDSSGRMHNRMRTYDPSVGRFLSRDMRPSFNSFAYSNNSPTDYSDPFGDVPKSAGEAFGEVFGHLWSEGKKAKNGVVSVAEGVFHGACDRYDKARERAKRAGASDWDATSAAMKVICADATGVSNAWEVVVGHDFVTGDEISAEERFKRALLLAAMIGMSKAIPGDHMWGPSSTDVPRPMGTRCPSRAPAGGRAPKVGAGATVAEPAVPNCFHAGTRVLTPTGERSIEEIQPGDEVLAMDPVECVTQPEKVDAVHVSKSDHRLTVKTERSAIQTTSGHPFWVSGTGWVSAAQLKPGDELVTSDFRIDRVVNIVREEGSFTIYNLTIQHAHTFFVGSSHVLVHNASPAPPPPPPTPPPPAPNPFGGTSAGLPKASAIKAWAEGQGWTPSQSPTGPLKFIDSNGIERVTIKKGSPRTPGSGSPHVEVRDAAGKTIDPNTGKPVVRKSAENHTPIDYDLP